MRAKAAAPGLLGQRRPLSAEDVAQAERAAARLMDPGFREESEEDFKKMFGRGMVYRPAHEAAAAAAAPTTATTDGCNPDTADAPKKTVVTEELTAFHEAMAAVMARGGGEGAADETVPPTATANGGGGGAPAAAADDVPRRGDRAAELSALRAAMQGIISQEMEMHAALHGGAGGGGGGGSGAPHAGPGQPDLTALEEAMGVMRDAARRMAEKASSTGASLGPTATTTGPTRRHTLDSDDDDDDDIIEIGGAAPPRPPQRPRRGFASSGGTAGNSLPSGFTVNSTTVETGTTTTVATMSVMDLDDDGLEVLDLGTGVSASLLDTQHADLQDRVRFDNFVDDVDISPDDVSDASDAEWVDVAMPTADATAATCPPVMAQRRVKDVQWLPPSDSDPMDNKATPAQTTESPPKTLEEEQAATQIAQPKATGAQEAKAEVVATEGPVATSAAPPASLPWEARMKEELRKEEQQAKGVGKDGKPLFGPAPPPPKRSYATDYPEVNNARPQEKLLRRWMESVQTVALPPGWTVNAATLKSMPPHEDPEAARAREQAAMDEAFAPENIQRLHAKLVEENGRDFDKDISEIRPITDADLFVEDEVRKYKQDDDVEKKLPEYLKHLAGINQELFSTLNAPAEETAASRTHEAAYVASKAQGAAAVAAPAQQTQEEQQQPRGYTIPDDVEPPERGGAFSSRPAAADGVEQWDEPCEAFALDDDFDYDNIENLTAKPRTPWEV